MDKRMEINKVVKESLCEALLYFMERKPFQNITITELITKAGVARATYYRNFDSKEDLAREYISNIAAGFHASDCLANSPDSYERILKCWEYVEKYKDVLILYNNAGLSDLLLDNLSNMTLYNIDRAEYPGLDDMYFAAFIGALYSLVRKWLNDGAKRTSREMADIFYKIWGNKDIKE